LDFLLTAFDSSSGHHGAQIGDALIFLAAAVLFAPLLKRLRFSLVLGYLAAGAMIGPSGFHMIDDTTQVRELADIGVVFLLFAIGLELSFERLKVMRRLVFGLGTGQMVLTTLALVIVSIWVGQSFGAAVVIGAALALSSTAFVLQLMTERGELSTRHGRAVFSTLLFQDLAVVPILVIVPLIGAGGTGESMALALLFTLVKAVVALTVIVVAGRLLLRPLYRVIAAAGAPELFTAMTLLVVLGIGWATQMVGLSMALGAFLAGLLLSESEFRHQVEADIEPFRGILLGLFFMTVGMSIDLGLAFSDVFLVLACLGGLIAIKFALMLGVALAMRLPVAAALKSAALLAQGGEFAFVIIGAATAATVVSGETGDLLFLVIALSMTVTPAIVWGIGHLAGLFERHHDVTPANRAEDIAELEGHIIIAGFGRVGRTVARLLDAKLVPYIAIDTDVQRVRDGRRDGHAVYFGNAARADVLRLLGGEKARAVVVTMSTQGHAVDRTVSHVRRRLPHLPIYARARDAIHARRLEELGVEGTVLETLEASLQLGGVVLRNTGVEAEQVEELIRALRHVDGIDAVSDQERQM
jgi:monovalent cation:H+ antiporter-2, CPA2 family